MGTKTEEKVSREMLDENGNLINNSEYTALEDEGFEGESIIFKEKGDSLEGCYCGRGRDIGEGNEAFRTHLFMNDEGRKFLLKQHSTLKDLEKLAKGRTNVFITYTGQQVSKAGRTYHTYSIQHKAANINREKGLDYKGYEG